MRKFLTIVIIFIFGLLLPACSKSKSTFLSKTSGHDSLSERELLNIPFFTETIEGIEFLGIMDSTLVFKKISDQSLHIYKGPSEDQEIFPNLDFGSIRCFQVPSGLLLTDAGARAPYQITKEKKSFQNKLLPPFPAEISNARITFIEKNGVLYLGASVRGNFILYSLIKNSSAQKRWKELTRTDIHSDGKYLISLQSNGMDDCLYVFVEKVGVFYYNLRLGSWIRKNVDTRAVEQSCSAFGRGAAHIVFPDNNGYSIHLFNTITDTFYELETTPAEGILKNVQVVDNQVLTTYYRESTQSIQIRLLTVEKVKNGFSHTDIIVLILYFGALVFIGYYFSKRQKNADDYFRGGHRIPWWAAGLSLFGTSLSAITFMAIPAKAFATNWSYMLFNSGILMVAPIIMFVFIPFFRKLNITTAYEYLEARFNALIRVICSLAFIVFQIGRMGVILLLPSIAINVVTGFDIFLCIALMGVFSIVYTRMGGIEAVVWTDALQVVILLGGALFAIFHIVGKIPGGWSETISVAYSSGKMSLGSPVFNLSDSTVWTVLIATFFTNLTTYGTDQSMVQRYLTTSSQKAARKSVMTNALLTIPATLIFFLIGTVLFVYYKNNPSHVTPTLDSNDAIFPWYIYTKLPVGMVGLLIAGIFAAAMSTLSGSMNSVATAYVVDIRPKLFRNKPAGDLKVARRATLISGALSLCFAFFMATWNINSLWDEFNKLLGLILGSMGGLFLLGMVTKKANAHGALIGMIVSIAVQLVVANYTPVHLLLYTSIGFITCFVVGYLASYFFKNK